MSNVNKSSTRNKRPLNSGNAGNSKKKREEIHLVSCRDASCTGCAEGEVELVFTKTDGEHGAEQPMATQLYQFALEESNRSGELTPIARKLFERAIEAFNEEERAYVTASATIDPTAIAELSTENLKHQLLYANCLLTFGQQLSLTDKVQQAIEILKRLSKGGHQSAWIHLGRAQLTAVGMKLERLKQMQSEEEDDSEDDSEDENSAEIQPIILQLDEVLASFDKVISSVEKGATATTDSSVQTVELTRLLAALQTFIETVPVKSSYHVIIYKTTTWIVRQLDNTDPLTSQLGNWAEMTQDSDAHRLMASLLYQHALHVSQQQNDTSSNSSIEQWCLKALDHTTKAKQYAFNDANIDQIDELTGYIYLLKSNVVNDDDEVLADFDTATEVLLRVYQRNPHNEQLAHQLAIAGMLDDSLNSASSEDE